MTYYESKYCEITKDFHGVFEYLKKMGMRANKLLCCLAEVLAISIFVLIKAYPCTRPAWKLKPKPSHAEDLMMIANKYRLAYD